MTCSEGRNFHFMKCSIMDFQIKSMIVRGGEHFQTYSRINLAGLVQLLVKMDLSSRRQRSSAQTKDLSISTVLLATVNLKIVEVSQVLLTDVARVAKMICVPIEETQKF